MIFVTTGSHYLPFDRLLIMINELQKSNIISEKIIIQSGTSKIEVQNAKIYNYIPYQKMIHFISTARVVITAAGPATVFQILKFNDNLPIVIPRRKEFKEHVSDHQISFGKYLEKNNFAVLANSLNQLSKLINNPHKNNINIALSPSDELISKLKSYISNI